MASIEDRLRERLLKVEALHFGAATPGERDAAEAARRRLRAKLAAFERRDPPVELQFTLSDPWSVQLFVALCRRYGLRPYRYPRQRRTTVMVRGPRGYLDAVIWQPFQALDAELRQHLEETTDRLIRAVVHAEADDAETRPPPVEAR